MWVVLIQLKTWIEQRGSVRRSKCLTVGDIGLFLRLDSKFKNMALLCLKPPIFHTETYPISSPGYKALGLDQNYTNPGSSVCQMLIMGFLSLYDCMSQCFIICMYVCLCLSSKYQSSTIYLYVIYHLTIHLFFLFIYPALPVNLDLPQVFLKTSGLSTIYKHQPTLSQLFACCWGDTDG